MSLDEVEHQHMMKQTGMVGSEAGEWWRRVSQPHHGLMGPGLLIMLSAGGITGPVGVITFLPTFGVYCVRMVEYESWSKCLFCIY
jgi:hypothetical protein